MTGLATFALLAGVACFIAGAAGVILRAADVIDVPLAVTTGLGVLGMVLVAAGASMQRRRRGDR
ncbi:MAG TPA: hypothetical protein VFY23_16540 [Candidatus Limnocylindrales bacterium]|nr:hypothetical protein [Candidatus Limnocylindrales bacterium]